MWRWLWWLLGYDDAPQDHSALTSSSWELIPRKVADEVGVRGRDRKSSIAAAIWYYGQLDDNSQQRILIDYLGYGATMRPDIEHLERRETPTATAFQSGSTLFVLGDGADDKVSVFSGPGNQTGVDLDFDGAVDAKFDTTTLTNVVISGGGGDDILANQPGQNLPTTILGGPGSDNITSFVGGVLSGGPGRDQIYQIVTAVAIDGGAGRDRIVASVAATIDGDPQDDTPVIFGQAQTDAVQLIGGVVYFAGTAGNDTAFVARIGGTLRVSYNGGSFTFAASDVDVFAGVFGAGNDTLILAQNARQRTVAYGGSGQDFFQAGAGDALLKGGADSDVVLGGLGDDDLTGSNGEISAAADYVDGDGGSNLLRVDANDVFFAGFRDIVVGVLMQAQRKSRVA